MYPIRPTRLFLNLLACVLALAFTQSSDAAVFQWDGGGANTTWGTAGNWVGSAPSSTDQNDLEFGTVTLQAPGQTTANNTSSGFNLNSITFGNTAGTSFSLTGSQIELKKDGSTQASITQSSNSNQSIIMSMKIGGDQLTFTGNGTGRVTIGAIDTAGKPLIKSGTSSYILTGALSGGTHSLTINDGTFAVGTGGNISSTNVLLRGGVLAMQGTFNRSLGSTFNWGAGGGGFAAFGGTLTVDIGGSTSQSWGASNFVPAGSPLIFGSAVADNLVTYVDEIHFATGGAATREIRVIDNPDSDADSARITGRLTSGGAAKSLNKTGNGVLELTNGTNNYDGGTTVSAGTLLANNTSGSATGTGAVTVNGSGTLGGTGSVSGDVTINGGTLAPGASVESLSTGAVNFQNGTFSYEIKSDEPLISAADLLDVNGNLSISGTVTLAASDLGSVLLAAGTKFTMIAYDGTWNGGTFAGVPNFSAISVGLNNFQIRYDDTTPGANFANETLDDTLFVTLTAVPEASSIVSVGLCGLFAIAAIRFGKRFGFAPFSV